MLVSERGIAADRATARASAAPADRTPILIARADLSRTPPARHTACDCDRAAAPRGRRGVTYDTVMATGRLGGRRRGLAWRTPSRRRDLARPGAPRRVAGGAGRARVLDVQTGRRRRVTRFEEGRSSV